MDGSDVNWVLATQSLICLFLPLHKPQEWIGTVFRLWATFQSESWDEQWLDLLARLSCKHIDPNASDPRLSDLLKAVSSGQEYSEALSEVLEKYGQDSFEWIGLRKDVGIYTEKQWSIIMAQCIRFFEVPLGAKYSQIASFGATETDEECLNLLIL